MNTHIFDSLCPYDHNGAVYYYPPGRDQHVNIVESVRKRPGMYVGGIGANGVHTMLFDILDLLIELCSSYQSAQLSLELSENRIMIRSNQLSYENISGWSGLSLPVAAALSQRFQLFLTTQKQRVCRNFEKGIFTGETDHPFLDNWLIEVQIRPDPEIFTSCKIDYFSFYNRCYTLAALYPGISISLYGEKQYNQFCFPEGMCRLLTTLGPGLFTSNHDDGTAFEHVGDGVLLRGVIKKCSFPRKPLSYVNGLPTLEGGIHVEGVRQGIVRSIRNSDEMTFGSIDDYVRNHYEFAIAVWLDNPQYAGSVKRKLENSELVNIVSDIIEHNWKCSE